MLSLEENDSSQLRIFPLHEGSFASYNTSGLSLAFKYPSPRGEDIDWGMLTCWVSLTHTHRKTHHFENKVLFLVAQLVKNPPALEETWVGKIPWRKERLPTPVFWPGEFQELYNPWGRKESDTTESLSLSLSLKTKYHYSEWGNCSGNNLAKQWPNSAELNTLLENMMIRWLLPSLHNSCVHDTE